MRMRARIRHVLEQRAPKPAEVGMLRVVDLRDTPWVDPRTDQLTIHFDLILRANDRKRHKRLGAV